jgi:hypothetical protein
MSQEIANSRLKRAAAVPPAEKSVVLPSHATMEEVQNLFKRYAEEVAANAELSQSSKTMYIDFAGRFVRWMVGEFKPVWPRRPLE